MRLNPELFTDARLFTRIADLWCCFSHWRRFCWVLLGSVLCMPTWLWELFSFSDVIVKVSIRTWVFCQHESLLVKFRFGWQLIRVLKYWSAEIHRTRNLKWRCVAVAVEQLHFRSPGIHGAEKADLSSSRSDQVFCRGGFVRAEVRTLGLHYHVFGAVCGLCVQLVTVEMTCWKRVCSHRSPLWNPQ